MGYVLFIFGLSLLVAVYLAYPSPTFSDELTAWSNKGKFMIIKGQRVFFVDHTSTSAPIKETIVCIHGFPTSSYDYHKMWPDLTNTFERVVTFDFIGFGLSDKPQKHSLYSIREHAIVLERLVGELGLGEVHLMAHDIGVTVVQQLLDRSQNGGGNKSISIKSVCFLNGGLFPETNHPFFLQKLLAQPYIGDVVVRILNRFVFSYKVNQLFGRGGEGVDGVVDDYWALLLFRNGHLILPDLLQYMEQRWLYKDRLTAALQQKVIPMHMIYGTSDPINPPDFIAYLRSTVPHMTVDLLSEGVGHFPQLEDPKSTFKHFLDFLKNTLK